ncbi:MAG: Xaa-Pro peptidase family protein, partial [Desulfatiglandaceae bacterium]
MATRIQKFKGNLDKASVDAGWIVRPENRRYLSGFKARDSQLDESSGSLLIGKDSLVLLTDSRYSEEASMEAEGYQVEQVGNKFPESFSKIVERIGCRNIGFEKDYLTWGMHARVSAELEKLDSPRNMVPLEGEVENLRRIKDAEELEAMDASARMIAGILDVLIDWIEPGMTEREVAWHLAELANEAWAEGLSFPPIIASGPNSSLPHAVPSGRRLVEGEPVVMDVGVILDGYCSDMTRTVFIGEPADRFKTVYSVVRRAQQAALDVLRPGAVARDVDRVARKMIEDEGYGDYFGHGLGHGVGLAVHEAPRLNTHDSTVLEEGMVVTVEPGIYLPGKGGVRLEETVVVEEEGPR